MCTDVHCRKRVAVRKWMQNRNTLCIFLTDPGVRSAGLGKPLFFSGCCGRRNCSADVPRVQSHRGGSPTVPSPSRPPPPACLTKDTPPTKHQHHHSTTSFHNLYPPTANDKKRIWKTKDRFFNECHEIIIDFCKDREKNYCSLVVYTVFLFICFNLCVCVLGDSGSGWGGQ